MTFWNFIKYCFTCMLDGFSAMFGHVPKNFTWKEVLVGIATLLVLFGLLILLAWLFSIIGKKK